MIASVGTTHWTFVFHNLWPHKVTHIVYRMLTLCWTVVFRGLGFSEWSAWDGRNINLFISKRCRLLLYRVHFCGNLKREEHLPAQLHKWIHLMIFWKRDKEMFKWFLSSETGAVSCWSPDYGTMELLTVNRFSLCPTTVYPHIQGT